MANGGTTTAAQDVTAVAQRIWWLAVLQGVLAILFGIVALVFPIRTAALLAIVVGAYAVVYGATAIIAAIQNRRSTPMALRLTVGIISVVFGLSVVLWPGLSLAALAFMLAGWAIVVGILEIVASAGGRNQVGSSWIWGVARGAIWVLLGIAVAFVPSAGIVALIWVLGLGALLSGVLSIFFGVQLRRAAADTVPPPI